MEPSIVFVHFIDNFKGYFKYTLLVAYCSQGLVSTTDHKVLQRILPGRYAQCSLMNKIESQSRNFLPLIKKCWVIENLSERVDKLTHPMISDGHLEILLVEGSGGSVQMEQNTITLHPGRYLIGQLNGKARLCLFPQTKLYFVKPQPWASMLITDCPLIELQNGIVPLSSLNSPLDAALRQFSPLAELVKIQEVLTEYLWQRSRGNSNYNMIYGAALKFMASGQDFRIQKQYALDQFNISDKTLENKFKRYVGLTPKQFSMCIKMRKAVEEMIYEKSHANLTNLAIKSGFFDQSHFIRSFKSVFKTTPGQLKADDFFIPNSKEPFRYYTI